LYLAFIIKNLVKKNFKNGRRKNFIVLIFDIQELLHKYKQKRKSSYVIEKID